MPRISVKALILSNIAHWIFFGVGVTVVLLLFLAYATVASDGASSLPAAIEQMKSSPALAIASSLVFVIAPIPAGYIAARIAPHDKLVHGALATAAWMVFGFCFDVWGGKTDGALQAPYWLDFLVTYGAPLPGVLGAYIWERRDGAATDVEAATPATTSQAAFPPPQPSGPLQRNEGLAATSARDSKTQGRRMVRTGTGLGVFLFLLMQFLLTKHEQFMVVVAGVAALALLLGLAFVSKALKGQST
jgi:hypothetical protein